MEFGWTIQSAESAQEVRLGVYVWFNSPKGDKAVYGCPAPNVPMAWVRLDNYIHRVTKVKP